MHRSASKVTELFPILSTSCNCILQVTKTSGLCLSTNTFWV